MKYAILIARILMGLIFLVFGANKIIHFIPVSLPPGDPTQFITIMAIHKWLNIVALLEIAGGILLLVGRFVPLALTLLGPVVVNIFLFHALLAPSGLPMGIGLVVLELFLLFAYRLAFRGIFTAGPEVLGSVKV